MRRAKVVQCITQANNMYFESAVKAEGCRGLLSSLACQLCGTHLAEREAAALDADRIDQGQEQYRALRLLFILAALCLENTETIEALRLMGTHGVDARYPKAKQRYAVAGRDRARPVTTERGFTRARPGTTSHLERVEQSLEDSLYELLRNTTVCQAALDRWGDKAIKYLGGLR